jgi:L-histidine N-alpha-methyltransferase
MTPASTTDLPTSDRVLVDVHLQAADWRRARSDTARRSLADSPPWIEPLWFYDEHGSALFDEITRLPEYYPTRAERSLLAQHAADLVAGGFDTLVELGSGTSDKTVTLLDAMAGSGSLRSYVPFDVSEETLRHAANRVVERYPGLFVHGVVGDFHAHLGFVPREGRRVVAFLGSTIGNLDPTQRRRFFADLDVSLDREDRFLLGVDLVKDVDSLVAAYDDAAGVTAAFNRNALRVLNRTLGSDFDPDGFDHLAVWNDSEQWIEMRLRAAVDQVVHVPGLPEPLRFADGDELRTEISAKFTVEGMTRELWESGFVVDDAVVAPGDQFALLSCHPYC